MEKFLKIIFKFRARIAIAAGLCFFLFAAGAAYLVLGPPRLIEKTESPEFCASCHLHEKHYETWFHNGAHREKKCVDCHLPNDGLVSHFTWKGIDGAKDVALFYSGMFDENIKLTGHAKRVLQDNCIRCHSETVCAINTDVKNCWECHRRMTHVPVNAGVK